MTDTHSPEQIRDIILNALEDNKAENIITVPLAGKSAIADYMIIASGRSARHVVGLSNGISQSLAEQGLNKGRFEGKDNGDWVMGDTGDVIIHLFRPEVREFYNIEKIWCEPDFMSEVQTKHAQQNARSSIDAP